MSAREALRALTQPPKSAEIDGLRYAETVYEIRGACGQFGKLPI